MKNTYQRSLDDYAAYHQDPRNKMTHYVGIPAIVFAVIILLRAIALPEVGGVALNGALVAMVPVGIFYLSMNLGTGIGMLMIFAIMYILAPWVSVPAAWALFVGGWILQFIGHHFEGKKPAFLKNGVHLLIGPLWILNDFYSKIHLPAYTGK